MKTLKNYIFSIFIVSLVSIGTWLMILFNYNPYKSDIVTIIAFYTSLLLWVTGIFSLIGSYIRTKTINHDLIQSDLFAVFRQSLFISLAFVGILIMQTLKVLTWWDGILLVLAILLLELFFRTKK